MSSRPRGTLKWSISAFWPAPRAAGEVALCQKCIGSEAGFALLRRSLCCGQTKRGDLGQFVIFFFARLWAPFCSVNGTRKQAQTFTIMQYFFVFAGSRVS